MSLDRTTDVEQLRAILAEEQAVAVRQQVLIRALQQIDPLESFGWSKDRCEQFTNAAYSDSVVPDLSADDPSIKLLGIYTRSKQNCRINASFSSHTGLSAEELAADISPPFQLAEIQQIRKQCEANVRHKICEPVIKRMDEIRREIPDAYNVLNGERTRQEIVNLAMENVAAEVNLFDVTLENALTLHKAATFRALPGVREKAEQLLLAAKEMELKIKYDFMLAVLKCGLIFMFAKL